MFQLVGAASRLATIHMELRHLKQMSLAAKVMALIAAPMQKKLLNLCHDWLDTFMPHCLVKVNRVSFGLLKDEVSAAVRSSHELTFGNFAGM